MLERAPFRDLDHAAWRATMVRTAQERPAGSNPETLAGHMEATRLLVGALAASRHGTPAIPPWTALTVLP